MIPMIPTLFTDPSETGLSEQLNDLFGDGSLTIMELPRLTNPTGGQTHWSFTLPTEEQPTITAQLEGVIIGAYRQRGWWPSLYTGNNDAPSCASMDMINGYGDPATTGFPTNHRACATCPMNQMGTRDNGNGKACKESQVLLMVLGNQQYPVQVKVPTTSLANVSDYWRTLKLARRRPEQQLTIVRLVKRGSYAVMTFAKGPDLPDQAQTLAAQYAAYMKPLVAAEQAAWTTARCVAPLARKLEDQPEVPFPASTPTPVPTLPEDDQW